MTTDHEDARAGRETRIKKFLSFWTTFPGVLAGGVLLMVVITVLIVVVSLL